MSKTTEPMTRLALHASLALAEQQRDELLAALRDILTYPHACDKYSVLARLLKAGSAAIAKAEGRQS